MSKILPFVASFSLAACSSVVHPLDTTSGSGTTSGASGTTGESDTTTGSGTSSGTTGGTSAGGTTGTTTGGGGSTACPSNAYTCPAGTARAGQVYPGASASDCGATPSQTLPDIELVGGSILNFSSTETEDDTGAFNAGSFFMHDLFCSGFRYVFIDVSARWCPHCKTEAGEIPGWKSGAYRSDSLYQTWLNAGGTVFSVLVEGLGPASATQDDLNAWIETYHTPYPMSLDSYQTMAAFIGLAGWPENIIVDLSDMKVLITVGGDVSTFYQTYCAILGIASCPSP